MNDNETKVMTFTAVSDLTLTFSGGSASDTISPIVLLGGGSFTSGNSVTPSAGRAFFAGMMFDRFRFRSLSVTLRPKVMPSNSATNYVVYAAWDRYGRTTNPSLPGFYSIRTDPSAKQVVWTPGGSGTPLRTWIYSTSRDRYQYMGIERGADLSNWHITQTAGGALDNVFYPILLVAIEAVTPGATAAQFTAQSRVVVEFQGGFSSTTLNYTPSSAAAAAASSTVPLEQRIAALESKYNSNPADNNDDFVSVLNELSNPQ